MLSMIYILFLFFLLSIFEGLYISSLMNGDRWKLSKCPLREKDKKLTLLTSFDTTGVLRVVRA